MSDTPVDTSKRTWLIASGCAGAAGAAFTAVPFVSSFQPSERAKAAGAPVEVDISALKPGEKMTVEWRGKPVWILKRTPEMLAALKKTDGEVADPEVRAQGLPHPRVRQERIPLDQARGLRGRGHLHAPGLLAVRPAAARPAASLPDNWQGGFLCPCHGSTFDLAGRVFKNKPAPDNLEVPPHTYLSDTRLLIGEDKNTKA
jgi:ubiquinol-cytochrome c reductase iron-sulfur subunit